MKNWNRSGRMIKHHIVNRCMGGHSTPDNLLCFDSEREKAWHFLFGNKSFDEVAKLLSRVSQIKKHYHGKMAR